MPWECEYTDTFAGEANYSWVRRETVHTNTELAPALTKAFKAALGLTSVRGKTYWHDNSSWEFRPYRSCTVAFARWVDE
jgi:hypothetical protein